MNASSTRAEPVESSFPPVPASAAHARRFAVAAAQVDGEVADDLAVVVSELASNAVLHAQAPFSVHVERRDGTVRVSVIDPDPTMPHLSSASPTGIGGRGLQIVAGLAARRGVDPRPPGKEVWAEFDATGPMVVMAPEELDLVSADGLERELGQVSDGADVVVDLARVRFCDSSGLRVLVLGHRRLTAAGGSLRLENVPGAVLRLLRLTGTDFLLGPGGATGSVHDARPPS